MSLTKKIAAGLVTGALALATFAPSVFAADLAITDNGAKSVNTITVNEVSVCDVDQNNLTLVGGVVSASASTGGNQANGNTGGSVSVTSGNATATATNTVTGGDNTAVNPCCCDTNPCDGESKPSAVISDNGRRSWNKINVNKVSVTDVDQNNATIVFGKVKAKAKTGWNKANGNTNGTTTVQTGVATSGATNTVTGGSNNLP